MSRFDELKEKEWKNLSMKERAEYKELKTKQGETVEIPKNQLEGIMARLSELESTEHKPKNSGEWEEVDNSDDVKTATLRFKDDKYCIDMWFHKNEINERLGEKELVYKFKWLLPDGTYEETESKLTDFCAEVEKVKVKLIATDVVTKRRHTGKALKKNVDYGKHRSTAGGWVDTYETKDEITYVALLPDGRKIKLPETKFNN